MTRQEAQIAGILDACLTLWGADVRYVATSIPSRSFAQMCARAAVAQASESARAEQYRARLGFGLQS
jgi:hypothetical protein